jgi:hypothetical protein
MKLLLLLLLSFFFLLFSLYSFHAHTQNGDENSIINWIYDGDRLKTGEDDDEIVTVEDVKRKMEMFHLNR